MVRILSSMPDRKILFILLSILSALLLISLYKRYRTLSIAAAPKSPQVQPTSKSIFLSRNELADLEINRNQSREKQLWSVLHKHQAQNTGFIHVYQQMITGGPFGERRHREIRETIQYNIDHIHVRYLYMAVENGDEKRIYREHLKDPLGKVKFIPFGRQSNYSDVFAHIMKNIYPHLQKDEVWMLANSDIALGEGFHMIKGHINPNTLLLISRHDKFCSELNQCFHSGGGSTDIVVGSSKVNEEIYNHFNFKHYARGGEVEIMKYLRKAGFILINPCIDIKIYHNHCSEDRSWGKDKRGWKQVNPGDTITYPIKWADYLKQNMSYNSSL